MSEQTNSVLDSLIQGLPDSVRNIELNTGMLDPEKRSFLINSIARIAAKYDKTVSLESGDVKIVIEQLDLSPVYAERSLKLLGMSRRISRSISVVLSGYLEHSANGIISGSFNFHPGFEDVVSSADRALFEQSPYSFTRGVVTTKLGWTKYVEPGILIVAVSTIIYLFYSMRY